MKKLTKASMATVALAASLTMLVAGCGGGTSTNTAGNAAGNQTGAAGGPQDGGSIVIGQATKYDTTFIPQIPSDLYTQNIVNFAFDPLMTIDNNLNFVPDLMKSYSWSDDKKTLTVNLDPNANWTDGKPVTSDDVLFTMNVLASKEYNTTLQGSYGYLVSQVVGYDDILNGKKKSFDETGGFQKVDDKTFKITFKQADAAVLWSDIAVLQPMPKHALENVALKDFITTDFDKMPTVTDGPYKFVKVNGQDSVEMTRNDNYFRGKPHIQNVTFKTVSADVLPGLLANGSVNLVLQSALKPTDVDKLKQVQNVKVLPEPSLSYQYLGLKLYHKEFNQDFRQALMYGINRQAIVDGLLKGYGKVLNAPIPDVSWAAATPADGLNEYKYDPNKANELLDKAGWKIGPSGWRVDPVTGKDSIPLDYPLGNTVRMASATAIQQDLAKVHLKIELHQPQDFNALAKKVQTDDPNLYMWLMGWSLSVDPDPRGMYDSKAAYNYPRFNDSQNDQLINATANEAAFDKNVRKQALVKWEVYYNQQVPYIFLYEPDDIYAYTTNLQVPENDWTVTGPINPQEWWVKQ
ncbi:ABC transporter substrate-binding protein [Alicyclobacillus macrosporangiidus]|uniref:ABC transporter substrate-binding protein n=1 Tax=Alicyclobacillus macrosporangiidus TaxID=392015 RepID=UPI000496FCCF|nr:ABC transporter substrate-binding protein [Alicyclobacillus macrosporangiidus]